jgi:hypothetical protein
MALRGGWDQRASATIPLSCWSARSARSAWRRSPRCWRSAWRRWARSARRVIAPRASAGLGGVAFGVQFHHHPGAEGRVVLGAADPFGQLPTRPRPDRQLAVVEGHKFQVKARRGRPPGALASGGDRTLADRLGVAGRHAQPVAGEGLAQRRPGGAQLGRSSVDAAQPLRELEGALGFRTVREEAAGLPAQRVAGAIVPAPTPLRTQLSAGAVEADVEQQAATAPDVAAATGLSVGKALPQEGDAPAG